MEVGGWMVAQEKIKQGIGKRGKLYKKRGGRDLDPWSKIWQIFFYSS